MSALGLEAPYGCWTVDGYAETIDYCTAVLDSIRISAVEGLNRVPHGGVEVGGILFGVHANGTLRILDVRPIACEYKSGPSFVLSEHDQTALKELLETTRTAPELIGLEPVGWFHTHTRSEISFSAADRAIHDAFFPEAWQIALVVKPSNLSPTRIGVFIREPDGSIRSEHAEFILQTAKKDAAAYTPQMTTELAPSPVKLPDPEPAPVAPSISPEQIPAWRKVYRRWYLPAALLAGFVGGTAMYFLYTNAIPLSLRVIDLGAQLRIEWNRSALPIRWARGAELEIEDGAAPTRLMLDAQRLRTGSVTYGRQSGNVLVRMKVHTPGAGLIEETSQFVGALQPVSPPPPLVQPPVPSSDEAKVLREQLEQQASTVSRLEQMVSSIQSRPRAGDPPPKSGEERNKGSMKPPAPLPMRAANTIGPESQRSRQFTAPQTASEQRPAPLPPPPTVRDVPVTNPVARLDLTPIRPPEPVRPAPGPEPQAPAAKARPIYEGAAKGRLIWTGRLQKNGILAVQGNHCSDGSLTGELPGTPVKIAVHAGEWTPEGIMVYGAASDSAKGVMEAPGPQNGWNKTWYSSNSQRESDLFILEAPGPQNDWKRVVVRSRNPKISLIFMDWSVLSTR